MIFTKIKIEGAYLIDIEKNVDARGFFARFWCQDEFNAHGISPALVQANVSVTANKGTLRGLHYQLPPYQETKLIRCIRGAVHDVIIDMKPDSGTFGEWFGVRLSAENYRMIYVPEGVAQGFLTLEDDCEVIYLNSEFYHPEAEAGVRYNDPAFGIEWPLPIRIISTFLDPDLYIISAAKMKTHDRVVTTLSLKNILLGAPLNDYQTNDKRLMHTAANFSREAVLNYNMFHLAQEIYPDLGVIDGFEAMEGDGPASGTPVDAKLALASLDPLALDTLATKLMGFDPAQIMYLASMAEAGMGQGDLSKVEVLGTPAEQCQFHFKPHRKLIEPYGLTS